MRTPLNDRVAVGRTPSKAGGERTVFNGVETCGSATGCLRCARKARAGRAEDTDTVLTLHLGQGGHGLFLSLTFSHSVDDSADESLDDALTAWSSMTDTRRWKRFEAWIGMDGWIRATENSHSDANGFHPHHHCALLTERAVGLDETTRGSSNRFVRRSTPCGGWLWRSSAGRCIPTSGST